MPDGDPSKGFDSVSNLKAAAMPPTPLVVVELWAGGFWLFELGVREAVEESVVASNRGVGCCVMLNSNGSATSGLVISPCAMNHVL